MLAAVLASCAATRAAAGAFASDARDVAVIRTVGRVCAVDACSDRWRGTVHAVVAADGAERGAAVGRLLVGMGRSIHCWHRCIVGNAFEVVGGRRLGSLRIHHFAGVGASIGYSHGYGIHCEVGADADYRHGGTASHPSSSSGERTVLLLLHLVIYCGSFGLLFLGIRQSALGHVAGGASAVYDELLQLEQGTKVHQEAWIEQ